MSHSGNDRLMENLYDEGLQEGELIHGLDGVELESYAEKYALRKFQEMS